ncbi:PIG-L family deacetylase [Actinoplanes sp. GCM10030250]|uniref:PIG-L family deacetylase n=1 Tax=Actinoplanes sp. GCM10030250 TaxID=3273376 RepID=UPI0036131071
MANWFKSLLNRDVPAPAADGSWTPGTVMSIVAHPDDDLYFLNPGISVAITASVPVVSIVITAAEGDGRNVDVNDPDRDATPVDHAGYATARRVGLRRAYAKMAGLGVDAIWRRKLVKLRTGFVVERDQLEERPDVVLYFFNIGHRDGVNTTIPLLLDGSLEAGPTLPSVDLPADVQSVSRETLLGSLVELIEKHRPTVIRTLDPDPEHDWGIADRHVVSDHHEHTATARFTIEAVSLISKRWKVPPLMEYYRAYANRYWPMNLSPRVYREKAGYLSVYAGADGGVGDNQLGTDPYRSTHMYSSAQRYVATPSWLVPLPGGELAAFAVLGDRLAMWREQGPDKWQGPILIGEPGVMPTLAVAVAPSGAVHVTALRRIDTGERVEIEAGYLTVDGGTPSEWVSLGNPDAGDPDRRRQREMGVPAATVDGQGDLWVFVRDFTGGLSCRRQSGGEWQPWEPLGRGPLQDVPVAMTTGDGLVRVFVAAKLTVAHWRQEKLGGPLEPHHTLKTGRVASGGLNVARTAGDRACLLYRQGSPARNRENPDPASAIRAYREHEVGGAWPGGGADFGGPDGLGPIAALDRLDAGAGDLVMAQRNRFWTVSVAVPPLKEGRSRWRQLPGMISGAPALAVDAEGRGVLAVLGMDGRLHVSRQEEPGPENRFGAWVTV